jgi:hypothetical protein
MSFCNFAAQSAEVFLSHNDLAEVSTPTGMNMPLSASSTIEPA